jgi:hypothetical protein
MPDPDNIAVILRHAKSIKREIYSHHTLAAKLTAIEVFVDGILARCESASEPPGLQSLKTFANSQVDVMDAALDRRVAELEAELQRWKTFAASQTRSLDLALDGRYIDAD